MAKVYPLKHLMSKPILYGRISR